MAGNDARVIKERIDIVDVISDRVRLFPSGRGFLGLCPFHSEKTPSFNVSREYQNYHCFGCGKGGDVFSFVMETEGLSFTEALELLADRAGVELTRAERTPKEKGKHSLYEVMELAQKIFRSSILAPEGEAARAYLARRGVSLSDASRFELGWSAASWDSLWRQLKTSGVSSQDAIDAGLLISSPKGQFDRFRGRVMFPIRDLSGRLIAFGGRLVDGEGAKYLNSPEGALYSKRRSLYLLHAAKSAIKEKNRVILVEGYMDALRLHMRGYTESVASLGTSLTEEQARLIKRFSNRCFICYDSDAAGQAATIRGMYTLQTAGLDIYVISLPTGKDPDELLSGERGEELFEQAVQGAKPMILQHLQSVKPLLDEPSTRKQGLDSLFEGLLQLSPAHIAPYVPNLSAEMGLYPNQFWQELDKARRQSRAMPDRYMMEERKQDKKRVDAKPEDAPHPLEAALCALLFRDESFREVCDMQEILPLVADARLKEIIMALSVESPDELALRWHTMGDGFPLSVIAHGDRFCEGLEFSFNNENDTDPVGAVIDGLKRRRATLRLKYLDGRMKRQEATPQELEEFRSVAMEVKGGRFS
ncbi:DNA primase [Synergistales bacterium]|nr:DNA primase [Synergistales bacterium]